MSSLHPFGGNVAIKIKFKCTYLSRSNMHVIANFHFYERAFFSYQENAKRDGVCFLRPSFYGSDFSARSVSFISRQNYSFRLSLVCCCNAARRREIRNLEIIRIPQMFCLTDKCLNFIYFVSSFGNFTKGTGLPNLI